MLQRHCRTITSISIREIAAPERNPSSSGPAYSRPDRFTPRRITGAPVAALMMRLPDVVSQGRPFESSLFTKQPRISRVRRRESARHNAYGLSVASALLPHAEQRCTSKVVIDTSDIREGSNIYDLSIQPLATLPLRSAVAWSSGYGSA